MSNPIAEWLVAQWTPRLSEILLTMGDVQPKINVGSVDQLSLGEGFLWWKQAFDCATEGSIWIGAAEQAWKEVGQVVLQAAGVESAPSSELQSTYLEIIRQSLSGVAQHIGERLSKRVTCLKGLESEPQPGAKLSFQINIELASRTAVLQLIVADQLCDAIDDAERAKAQPVRLDDQAAPIPMDGTLPSRTFELLLDVELPLSVSFGRATIKLQDAVKLITGSMIELDRNLNDPVELLVNNCIIARGEVVVIEGNYGVRITEIVSQKARLQQTRRYMLQ